MLSSIREKFSGPIALGIITVIAITLVISFGNMDTSGAISGYAARVNGDEIPMIDFRRVVQNQMFEQQELFKGEFAEGLERQLQINVLDRLVRNRLITQYVSDAGYRVDESQVRDWIRTRPVFQVGGEYSYESYTAVLASQGLTPESYERAQRESLEATQFETGLITSSFYTPTEYRRYIELLAEQREATYVLLDARQMAANTDIPKEDLKAYYEASAAEFVTDESVDLEYVEVRLDDIAGSMAVDEAAVREDYDSNVDRYRSAEKRQARHILIVVGADSDEAEAEETILALAERLAAGEDFATLAAEYSDDPVSAGQGGDLGWAEAGDFSPAFEEALFALELDELSGPVRSEFGYHLIRVEAIEAGTQLSYEQVHDELVTELQEREAAEQFYALAERVDDLALENSRSLTEVASAAGLELKRIDGFTRNGGGPFGYNQALVDAAFSIPVLEDGENSPVIEVEDDLALVIRVAEHFPSIPREFATVADEIEEIVRREQGAAAARTAGDDILARVNAGESSASVFLEYGLEASSTGPMNRSSDQVEPDLLAAIYRTPRPVPDMTDYRGIALGNGGYAVYWLDSVTLGRPDDIPQQQRDQRKESMARQVGVSSSAALVENLHRNAKIQIPPDLFDADDSLTF
jgi:peptidyl-prolyl cis-trans isomerase D